MNDRLTPDLHESILNALPKTTFNRDLIALRKFAERLDEKIGAFDHAHDTGRVTHELIRMGAIAKADLADGAVWGFLDPVENTTDAARCFSWSLRMFISVLEAEQCGHHDEPDAEPCAIVGEPEAPPVEPLPDGRRCTQCGSTDTYHRHELATNPPVYGCEQCATSFVPAAEETAGAA